jgi:hypothetical protein
MLQQTRQGRLGTTAADTAFCILGCFRGIHEDFSRIREDTLGFRRVSYH